MEKLNNLSNLEMDRILHSVKSQIIAFTPYRDLELSKEQILEILLNETQNKIFSFKSDFKRRQFVKDWCNKFVARNGYKTKRIKVIFDRYDKPTNYYTFEKRS